MLTTTMQELLHELADREAGKGTRLILAKPLWTKAENMKLIRAKTVDDEAWFRLTAAGRIALADGEGDGEQP